MKHTFFKRIIALVLTLAMVLSLMPSVFAAESDLPFQDVEEASGTTKPYSTCTSMN